MEEQFYTTRGGGDTDSNGPTGPSEEVKKTKQKKQKNGTGTSSSEIELNEIRPRRGDNLIEVVLEGRPPKLKGGVIIDDIEINIEYSPFIRGQDL